MLISAFIAKIVQLDGQLAEDTNVSIVKLPPQVKPGTLLYFCVVTRGRTRMILT
jgi:hypothetical protein